MLDIPFAARESKQQAASQLLFVADRNGFRAPTRTVGFLSSEETTPKTWGTNKTADRPKTGHPPRVCSVFHGFFCFWFSSVFQAAGWGAW